MTSGARRRVFAVAAAAALAAAVLAARGAAASDWDRGAARMDTLAAADRLSDALALARVRERLVAVGLAPGWRAGEARATTASLERRLELSASSRAALARAGRRWLEGEALREADALDGALAAREEAWRTRLALLGPADLATLDAGLAVAESRFSVARVREADSLARAVRDGYERVLGTPHPRIAAAEELLGLIVKNFRGLAAYRVAIGHYERALRIHVATDGATSPGMASTLHELGNLHRAAGHADEAYALFGSALDIRRAHFGDVHDRVASSRAAMAFLRSSQGRWAEAERLAREALAATPAGPGASPRSRSARLGLQGGMLRRMERYTEAIPVLREAVALSESMWVRTPRDAGSTFASGLSLHRELAISLAGAGRGDEALEQFDRGAGRLLVERLVGAADAAHDPWRGLLSRLQRTLADDEAVVGWTRASSAPYASDYPVWAYVVRASGPVRWVRLERTAPLGPNGYTMREVLWSEATATAAWPLRATDATPVERMAALLWLERFAPLEPHLSGVRRLTVCTPDYFSGGPLGILRDARGRYLAERFVVSYTPSILLEVRARETGRRGREAGRGLARPALLVGDPAYRSAGPDAWTTLAGAGAEIAAIAARLPDATRLTGPDASAARLRSLAGDGALARYGLLHFAVHAEADFERPLETALVLAPAAGSRDRASRVTAREILESWRLDADLVSLAACRSMQGVPSATDGALGLQTALLAAGARSLLVALWPVDDRATAILMDDFYARLADRARPLGRAEALRDAQASLRRWRDPDGTRPFEHPAYWAGFVLVGDPD